MGSPGVSPFHVRSGSGIGHAELFKKAIERFPGMLVIVGADGRGLYFDPSVLAYVGTQPERSDGNRWFLFIHEEDRVPFIRKWRWALRNRKSFRAEARILHPEERPYRRFLVHAVPLGQTGSAEDTHLRLVGGCSSRSTRSETRSWARSENRVPRA